MIESRRLWVEALRSGKYKQGFKGLCNNKRYCCLGVACIVYQEHVGGLHVAEDADGTTRFQFRTAYLPTQVAEWLDITCSGVLKTTVEAAIHKTDHMRIGTGFDSLTALNDFAKDFDFAKIADLIESGNLKSFEEHSR